MQIFIGENPDSWPLCADRYFQIHKLSKFEKMMVAMISFEGLALNWYRSQEEREKFTGWVNMKERLLIRFRSIREGSLYGRFLRITQETMIRGCQNLFDKWIASLTDLSEKVVEETFVTGLLSWIKTEVDFCEPKGLAQMMQIAQKVENREDVRREANLPGYSKGRQQKIPPNTNKMNNSANAGDNKGYSSWPMRIIMLQGTSTGEVGKEGPLRRLSDAEFQARKEENLFSM